MHSRARQEGVSEGGPTLQPSAQMTVLLLLSGVMFLARTLSLMLAPLLVALAEEFHTTAAIAGQLAAATYVTWGILAPLVGPVSDTYGRRPVALVGMLCMGVGLVSSALAWNYTSFLACRLLIGVGGAMAPPNSMAAIADHFLPAQRGKAIGWLFSASWLGAVVGVPMVGFLAGSGGWRLPCYLLAALLACVWVCLWRWFPRSPWPATQRLNFGKRFQEVGRTAGVWAILATNVLQQMTFVALFTYLPVYLTRAVGLPAGAVALVLALVGVGAMAGSILGGRLAGRPRCISLLAVSLLTGGIGAGLSFAGSVSVWMTVGAFTVVAVLVNLGSPVLMSLMTELAGTSRATGIGMFGASNQLGGIGGASLGGVALFLGGFPLIGLLCCCAAMAAAMMVQWRLRDATAWRPRVPQDANDRAPT